MYTSYTMSYNEDITLTSFCEPTTANAYMVYIILKHNLNNVLGYCAHAFLGYYAQTLHFCEIWTSIEGYYFLDNEPS